MPADYEPDSSLSAEEQEQDMRDELASDLQVIECHGELKKILKEINWYFEESGIDYLKDKHSTAKTMATNAFMAVLEARMEQNVDSPTHPIRILLSCYIQMWGRLGEDERDLMETVFKDPFGRGYGELFRQTAKKIESRSKQE